MQESDRDRVRNHVRNHVRDHLRSAAPSGWRRRVASVSTTALDEDSTKDRT